jgi:hypothetical protein
MQSHPHVQDKSRTVYTKESVQVIAVYLEPAQLTEAP